jgi:glycosyltransferase involved in cell wall biosynthesis
MTIINCLMSTVGDKLLIILTPGFPSDENDTTCLPMQQQLILALNREFPQWTLKILSFQYPFQAEAYSWFGNEVVSFGGRNRGKLWRLFLRQKVFARLRKIHREQKIDGLFSFWFGECALVGKKFADKHKLKHYCWLLGQDARSANPYPQKVSLKGTELIALSDFLQAEYQRNHKVRPARVIAPGVVKSEFAFKKTRDIDLLGAGSLIQLKNFDLFIDLAALIKKKFPGLKAVIVGEGPERARLEEKIRIAGLQKNIKLTGQLSYNAVLEYMRRTKILLHPSSYEGFSGVCLEALASGAYVISFCKPMNTEIDHWTIVDSKEKMLERALAILQDPDTKMNTKPVYDINDTAKNIIALFDQ